MRSAVSYCCFTVFCAALFCSVPAHSQEGERGPSSDGQPVPATAPTAEAALEGQEQAPAADEQEQQLERTTEPWERKDGTNASGPDIYLLPDEQGSLRRVLGFRYEDFLRAWQQKNNPQDTEPPRFLIESIKASGKANDTHAPLEIALDIMPRVDGWLSVPLQLSTFLIQDWRLDDQAELECLTFDDRQQSYVLWLKGESGKRRTLTLKGLSKLKRGHASPVLEIQLPYAAESELVLRVPVAVAEFDASVGVELASTTAENGETEVRLVGHASPLRLQWRSSGRQEQPINTAVEVVGNLAVQIGQDFLRYDAALEINSHGREVQQLRVRLPEGARLSGEHLSGDYQVQASQESSLADRDEVVIRLREPRSDIWILQLQAEQVFEASAEEETSRKIGGFELVDAYRQSGTMALYVDERMQAYFDLQGDIKQVPIQESPTQSQPETLIGNFKYSRFPWGIDVHTIAKSQHVSVKPEYELRITQGEAQLEVKLDYEFAGAQVFAVRIDLRGWERTDSPIESNGAVEKSGIFHKSQDLLVLPLVDPDSQRVRINMTLRRNSQLGLTNFPLPEPLEASVLPGQLNVRSEPSLQVSPTIVSTEGVSTVAAPKESTGDEMSDSSEAEQETLHLRTFLARATLGAEVSRRERQIAVDVMSRVDVGQDLVSVSQQLEYHVKYRPVSQLLLQIPEVLWNNDTLRVEVDGEEVPIGLGIFSREGPAEETQIETPRGARKDSEKKTASMRQLVVSLPRPRLKTFVLQLAYETASPTLATDALMPIVLPLVAPDDQVEANQVSVNAAQPIRATLNQTAEEVAWKVRVASERLDSKATVLELEASGKPSTIPMLLQVESQEDYQLVSLESSWLQTWIVGTQRQERAVFRFRTNQPEVSVILPAALERAEIEVLLNGAPIEFELLGDRVTVTLDESEVNESHTLELRYQSSVALAGWGNLRTELPSLESRPSKVPFFWQLILPPGWHVATTPESLNPEYWLGWKNYKWGRQPSFGQFELENSIGATHAPMPAASSNQYLYRAFEIPREVDVLVVRQTWLALTSTLAAFAVGMLLIYTPLAQQGLFWLGMAATLLACVAIYPEITLLLFQAIFWGGTMTLIAFVLKKAFSETTTKDHSTVILGRTGSTAVTESWIHGQVKKPSDVEAPTASLQTGG